MIRRWLRTVYRWLDEMTAPPSMEDELRRKRRRG